MNRLTRRQSISMGIAGLGCVSCGPFGVWQGGAALAAGKGRRPSFEEALAAIPLHLSPARLDLIRLDRITSGGQTELDAVVRLTWPPGTRQSRFVVRERTEAAAEDALLNRVNEKLAALTLR